MMRLYGVGLFRTGTTSLWEMFRHAYEADHEFMPATTARMILSQVRGELSREELVKFLRERDRIGGLQVEVSGYLYPIVDLLAQEFTDARFIVTIRDCYSWVNSCMHKLYRCHLEGESTPAMLVLNGLDHPLGERLRWTDRPGFPFDVAQLIRVWAWANTHLLDTLPRGRTMMVRTDELLERTGEIASFLGVPGSTLTPTHANAGPASSLLHAFAGPELERHFEHHCGPLMERYFPQVTFADFQRRHEADRRFEPEQVRAAFSLAGA